MNTDQRQNMIGESESLQNTLDAVSKLGPLNRPALIIGERGTGKELIAERLHFLSKRWDKPFRKINCAALSEALLESELFGFEAGSFTGANKRHIGILESSDNGSLFLDELATMSQRLQEKLLRVIEYGEFERIGSTQTIKINVRIIAATNADLPKLASANQFRADLLDRLAFDVINLPPLRFRGDDIFILSEHFATKMAGELGWSFFPGFSANAKSQLKAYHWPGNIRELKNAIERSVYKWENPDIEIDSIILDPFLSPYTARKDQPDVNDSEQFNIDPNKDFKEQTQNYEIALLKATLSKHQHHQKNAAISLNLTYDQLRNLIKKYKMHL